MEFIKKVILEPQKAFEEIREAKDSKNYLLLGIGIVITAALLSSISGLILQPIIDYSGLPGASQEMVESMQSSKLVWMVLGAVIFTPLVLLVKTGVFHFMSWMFGGKGTFKKLLAGIAFASVPALFAGVIQIATAFYFKSVLASISVMELASYTSPGLTTPLGILYTLLVLWSIGLAVYALKEIYELKLNKAAVCVLLPYLVFFGITYWSQSMMASMVERAGRA